MLMKRTHPLGDEDKHQALIRSWMRTVQVIMRQPPEPGTASVHTANGIESVALGEDPVTQSITLLEMPNVSKIGICVNNLDAAADIAVAVRSHPETLRTVVRLYYNCSDSCEQLPILEAPGSQPNRYEQAAEQFLAAFTADAEDEPISMGELADTLNRWYQNLTGESISRMRVGRTLAGLGVRQDGQENTDRMWAEEVSRE